jgi:hypothetical protein
MGVCKFCHSRTRWFANAHDECVVRVKGGIERLKTCVTNWVLHGGIYDAGIADAIIREAAIPYNESRIAMIDGWSSGAEQRAKAEPISPEGLDLIYKVIQDAGFGPNDFQYTAGGFAMYFSLLIWHVLHHRVSDLPPFRAGQINFNMAAGETPVWLFKVLLKQYVRQTSYVGSYGGPSIRVASGLYYRFGAVRGHRVESTSLQELDAGDVLLTTRAIYFGGELNGISFRLPYSHIIRFEPYSDAIGICASGQREQIVIPTNVNTPIGTALTAGMDASRLQITDPTVPLRIIPLPPLGWFLFNILQALATQSSNAA